MTSLTESTVQAPVQICCAATREAFPNLDVAKFVMAYVVVAIHTQPLSGVIPSVVTDAVFCVAVPFFFIASGFLCFKGLDVGELRCRGSRASERVLGTIRKQLRLYGIWTVLAIPLSVFQFFMSDWNPLHAVLQWVRGVVFIGSNSGSNQLWYLLASAVAFVLVYGMLWGGASPKRTLATATAFLLLGWVLDQASVTDGLPVLISAPISLYYKVFANTRNGLFEGFFYVALGMVFGLKWDRVRGMRTVPLLCAAALAFAGCLLVSSDAHLPFCATLSASFFLLSVRRHGCTSWRVPFLRNMSTGVYLTHLTFAVIWSFGICGAVTTDLLSAGYQGWQMFLFVGLCSGTCAALACLAAKRWPLVGVVFGFA